MATTLFDSRIRADGSLSVPKEVVEELGIRPGDAVRVRVEAAKEHRNRSTALAHAKTRIARRTPEEIAAARSRAAELYPPKRTVPPGKTLADVVSGQWPGDESDEQVETALRELA